MAARGCLLPGANVCVAATANQISSAIRVFNQLVYLYGWIEIHIQLKL